MNENERQINTQQIAIASDAIREALSALYSPADLANTALANGIPEAKGISDLVQRAQLIRGLLLDAIESLRPVNRSGPTSSSSRAYDCLKLRYVSGQAVDDVAYELSLSARQVYRDLRWAEERIAEILSSRYMKAAVKQEQTGDNLLQQEAEAIARKPERVSLPETVKAAVSAIKAVAKRYNVTINFPAFPGDIIVTATPGILQQIVTQILSAMVQNTVNAEILVSISRSGSAAALEFAAEDIEKLTKPDLMEAALHVAEAQGLHCSFSNADNVLRLTLSFPLAKRAVVLVVEDKQGACALYERYVENTEFTLVKIERPHQVADIAFSEGAAVIVLDIMMPEADGWSVLQSLKTDPRVAFVPVVICSVINDRELGFTLGATDYLTKPVSRADFVDCLRRVLHQYTPDAKG